jgi:hypothetical protein
MTPLSRREMIVRFCIVLFSALLISPKSDMPRLDLLYPGAVFLSLRWHPLLVMIGLFVRFRGHDHDKAVVLGEPK